MGGPFKSLAEFFGTKKVEWKLVQPHEYAHLVIDVQRQFCDPRYDGAGTERSDRVARDIARITPEFRAAGMPTYIIYMSQWNKPPEKAYGGFHHLEPASADILFDKHMYSAFEYTDLAERLRGAGVKTLLVSGFDIECCVNATVQDALREKFNVWVLKDCIGNGGRQTPEYLAMFYKLMTDNGAELISAATAHQRLQQPRPA